MAGELDVSSSVAGRLGQVAQMLPDALVLVSGGVVHDLNRSAARLLGGTASALRGRAFSELVQTADDAVSAFLTLCSASRALVPGSLVIRVDDEDVVYRAEGGLLTPRAEDRAAELLLRLRPRTESGSRFQGLNEQVEQLNREVYTRMRAQVLLDGQRQVLEMIARGAPLDRTLEELVGISERHSGGGMIASILLLDSDGRTLRHGAGASLPGEYRDAIDGVQIGPSVGSCGTAVHRKCSVVVTDIATSPLWKDFADVALRHGLRACWSTPITASDGSIFGTFALYYDTITEPSAADRNVVEIVSRTASIAIERSRAEARLEASLMSEREARADAESANRAKDEFLALVSHELRNPLNAMLGWIRLLQADSSNPTVREKAIETIGRNANLQAELISDVLDFARVTSGRLTLAREAVCLRTVVDKACESVRPEAAAKDLQLDVYLAATTGPVYADPSRLQQAISNLLWNAVKFTPSGGAIAVRLEFEDDVARISVGDSGCGIDASFLPYVFEQFRQADGSTTREHGGLGLGLSIVRHIVELHDGQVSAYSEGLGHGATFTIALPIVAPPASEEPAPVPTAVRLDGAHVLVVDDMVDARELLTEVLERAGARVTAADSADAGLATLDDAWPDAVVCDVAMPGKDGHMFIRELRARETAGTRVPAFALTAHTRDIDRRTAVEAGFDQHVGKPLDPVVLVAAVASALGPRLQE